MLALLQRVREASVVVADGGGVVGAIGHGLLVFVCAEPDDGEAQARRLVDKVLALRVFADAQGRMNLSVREVGGGLLIVSQFTLAADTRSGNRPGFAGAATPAAARLAYERVLELARAAHPTVAAGVFGAHMQVHLVVVQRRRGVADACAGVRDGARGDAGVVEQGQRCDAGTVLADTGVVEHRERHLRLQREPAGADAAVRPADHRRAGGVADGLGDAVDDAQRQPPIADDNERTALAGGPVGGHAPRQSAYCPAALIAGPHLLISASTNFLWPAGVSRSSVTITAPSASCRLANSGSFSASRSAVLICCSTAGGVPLGAYRPCQI
jgi:D-tyrosyl-tRNA(Tyr) deacylase